MNLEALRMDKDNKIVFGFGILFVVLMVVVLLNAIAYNKVMHEACQDLGYKKYVYRSFNLCEDNNGDLHYVKYEKPPFNLYLTKDCSDLKMKEILVGVMVLGGNKK